MGKYYLNFSKMNIALGALATAGLAGTGYMAYKNHQLKKDYNQQLKFRDNDIARLNERTNELSNQLKERTATYEKYYKQLKEADDNYDKLEKMYTNLLHVNNRLTKDNAELKALNKS